MTEFTSSEQTLLDELVRQRTSSFKRPHWMQRHRARALQAEAERLIGASPSRAHIDLRPRDTAYYDAAARVRAVGDRSATYKIHEAGSDGRPICTMGQGTEWTGEHLGAGPVTCGKCAATRDP